MKKVIVGTTTKQALASSPIDVCRWKNRILEGLIKEVFLCVISCFNGYHKMGEDYEY